VVKSIVNETQSSTLEGEELHSAIESNPETSPTSRLESKENQHPRKRTIPSNCVLHFLFPLKTFHILQDMDVLPEIVQGKRIKYELDSNRLLVQVTPSPAHDVAANAWNARIGVWSLNGGAGQKTLKQCGQGRIFSVVG
jgi:hypothetical protein